MPLAQIIAAQAMRALLAEQRVTAANLANVGTSGYQKGVVAMRSFGDVLAGARRTRAEEARETHAEVVPVSVDIDNPDDLDAYFEYAFEQARKQAKTVETASFMTEGE